MDVLINLLEKYNFQCVRNFDKLCVVHCVPGAGKSSLIRELCSVDSRFSAYTFGVPDSKAVGTHRIKSICEFAESEKLCIIDEYTEGDYSKFKPVCVFGDPIQSKKQGLEPNYESIETKRFGTATCSFLREFGFKIESSVADDIRIGDPFKEEVVGVLLVIGREAENLARGHGAEFLTLEEFRGITREKVTVLTDCNTIPEELLSEFFIAFTRHRKSLLILCPNAVFGPSGQF